ncbi:MAG: FkbM family methyltransferase [Bacteroidota bacterium]
MIGAHEGQTSDPLFYYIFNQGWKGIMVEPQPDLFKKLIRKFKGVSGLEFENVAISKTDGKQKFHILTGPPEQTPEWVNQLASLNPSIPAALLDDHPHLRLESYEVACKTIKSLMAPYKNEDFNLLIIDAEGYDGIILKSIEFETFQPSLIVFEHCHLASTELSDVSAHLEKNNYTLYPMRFNTIAFRDPVVFKSYL